MLLCIDIGNTNIVIGVYRGEELLGHWRVATVHDRMADEYAMLLLQFFSHSGYDPAALQGVAIASVVPPLTRTFIELSETHLRQTPLVVDAGVRTGVRIRYDNPREVGADRVANAAATYRIYGGPACVVDFGTATTFDAISAEGDYLGGAIAPGIFIAAEALFTRTAKLPRIDLTRPPRAIGSNTVQSMQSGILFGYVGLVEGMVARFREELGPDMRVIGTGGLAEVIARETTVIKVVDPWLTLKGLRMIYEMNR
ncbi:MAG: type III pantothenate kinase [Anaerolineae bacterium]|jgi:type III pantothenate kinase|nr:type III pantothenate kinase [Anaerolineae bacterium]MDH7474394.1 type III pantothenate kinase [Anaerolineae bacterium]